MIEQRDMAAHLSSEAAIIRAEVRKLAYLRGNAHDHDARRALLSAIMKLDQATDLVLAAQLSECSAEQEKETTDA